MFALMSPKLWIAAALAAFLAFTHFAIYRSGKASVRAEWDAAKVIQQQALADAEKASRAKEQLLQKAKDEAEKAANIRIQQAQNAAASARAAANSLRDEAARTRSNLPSNSGAACLAYADAANTVLAGTVSEAERLARDAESWQNDALTCQAAWPR